MAGLEVLLVAPGAGLGHLTRAAALALALTREGLTCRIVTNSFLAPGLSRLTGLIMDRIPGAVWARTWPDYLAWARPGLLVLDTFPFGWRGEWARNRPETSRVVLLARRLNLPAYLIAHDLTWSGPAPSTRNIIQIEPLSPEYLARLAADGGEIEALPGRIRFPWDELPTPVPDELTFLLATGKLHLVVHGGPETEVSVLVAQASRGAEEEGGLVAVIRPGQLGTSGPPTFEYYPAARLYGQVRRVYTGAGYNALAEAAAWPSGRVRTTPFPRRYDEQTGRLAGPPAGVGNGTPRAVQILTAWAG